MEVDRLKAATEEELMEAYVAGDKSAFAELFSRLSPLLTAIARRRLGGDDSVQDVVQQSFLQLHRARFDYRKEALLRPWIATITINIIRERGRKAARRPEVKADIERASDGGLPRAEVRQALLVSLEVLGKEERELLRLHWIEGLSFPEIASKLGKSSGALRVSAHRALAKLKDNAACNVLPSDKLQENA